MAKKKRPEKEKQYITNNQVSNVLDVMKDTTDNDKVSPRYLNSKDRIPNKDY